MFDRRGFLKGVLAGSGLLALDACYVARFTLMPGSKKYRVEKEQRDDDFQTNTSNSLRRYSSLPGDPLTRESQLVELARKEKLEDAFAYVQPEKVWYEVGSNETSYEVNNLLNSIILLSQKGKVPEIKKLHSYHFHPVFATAKLVLEKGWLKSSMKPGETPTDLAYRVCLQPSPAAFDDLDVEKRMRKDLKGVDLVSRVADAHGIWEYCYNEDFMKRMKTDPVAKYKIHHVTQLLDMSQIYVKSQKKQFTGDSFIKFFQKTLRKSGYKGDEIQLSFRQVKPFQPSKEEFKHNLRKWRLIK